MFESQPSYGALECIFHSETLGRSRATVLVIQNSLAEGPLIATKPPTELRRLLLPAINRQAMTVPPRTHNTPNW